MKKFKKGFTLAEILIVLTIIGVMAVMTIPSLIQNSNSQQKIAMFKKSFNAVSNAYATEFALKTPPTSANFPGKKSIYEALIKQLNVKYYILFDENGIYQNKIYTQPELNQEILGGYKWGNFIIVTEDGIGYTINGTTGYKIKSRAEVNSAKTSRAAAGESAIAIYADININNKKSIQCNDNLDLNKLNCDTVMFFVSKDGITSGNPDCTISGRIMSDNMEYDENKCKEE